MCRLQQQFAKPCILNKSKYTYDPKCVPPRISNIRAVIVDLDDLIEKELDLEVEDETPNT